MIICKVNSNAAMYFLGLCNEKIIICFGINVKFQYFSSVLENVTEWEQEHSIQFQNIL